MKEFIMTFGLLVMFIMVSCQGDNSNEGAKRGYKKALVSYDDFKMLVDEVESIRSARLISLDTFLEYQKEGETIILDTRSRSKYEGKHIKGAINLPFPEFTQANLKRIIKNTDTRILIYCNNNFEGDSYLFASKIYTPEMDGKMRFLNEKREVSLALNIPTYINLYGYGYRNIYELNELVKINDPRIQFEGTNYVNKLRKTRR